MRSVYSLILYTITPLFFLRLWLRARKAPAYLKRWNERLAIYPKNSPKDHVIWLHAVSVGEVEAAFPLTQKIQKHFPQYSLLITTTTPTGSSRVKSLFGETVNHVYLPFDLPISMRRFYHFFNPLISIVMETEIWPNFFYYGAHYDVPIIIVNARLSQKSTARYAQFPSFVRSTLAHTSLIAAQSRTDADRFIEIGAEAKKLTITGNIKFDLVLPKNLYQQSEHLRKKVFIERPVLIAASTHEGEDAQVLDAFAAIKIEYPELLLILVPRHPERFDAVAALCRGSGFSVVRRSNDLACSPKTDVFLGDTLGELKLFYAASDIAFVGGSLMETGGHNVLEPAALGIPVIVGPHTFNFEEISHLLVEAEAAIRVNDRSELANAIKNLLADKILREKIGENGRRFVEENRGAVDKTFECIAKVLERK